MEQDKKINFTTTKSTQTSLHADSEKESSDSEQCHISTILNINSISVTKNEETETQKPNQVPLSVCLSALNHHLKNSMWDSRHSLILFLTITTYSLLGPTALILMACLALLDFSRNLHSCLNPENQDNNSQTDAPSSTDSAQDKNSLRESPQHHVKARKNKTKRANDNKTNTPDQCPDDLPKRVNSTTHHKNANHKGANIQKVRFDQDNHYTSSSSETESMSETSETTERDPQANKNPRRVASYFNTLDLPNKNKKILKDRITNLQAIRTGNTELTTKQNRQQTKEVEAILHLPSDREEKIENGKLMCPATIGNVPIDFELDCGSASTLITKDIFDKIHPDIPVRVENSKPHTYKDVNGNKIESTGFFYLPITLGNKVSLEHPVLVVELSNKASHCLLGVDLIRHKRFSIIHANDARIYLSVTTEGVTRDICLKDQNRTFVKETTTLEGGEVAEVEVTLDQQIHRISSTPNNLYGVSLIGNAVDQPNLLIPDTALYTVGDNASIKVPVINRSWGRITIFENETILTCSKLDPGTVLEDKEGQRQVVLSDGRAPYTIENTIATLEKTLELKNKTPKIQTKRRAPERNQYYLCVQTNIRHLPDEHDLLSAGASLTLTPSTDKPVTYVTGEINPTASFTTHLMDRILNHQETNLQETNLKDLIINITDCKEMKSLITQAYYRLATQSPHKLPTLTLITNQPLQTEPQINKIRAMNDEDPEVSTDLSEGELCEELFCPLNDSKDFWKDLVASAPKYLQPKLFSLIAEKHHNVFPKNSTDFGNCTLENSDFKINLKNEEIFNTRPYPLNTVYSRQLNETIDEMLAAGLLLEESSAYGSGVFIRPRPDSTGQQNYRIRVIYDLRRLNSLTIPDSFPIPNIRSLLQNLQGRKFHGLLDLKDSYQAIKICPTDRHKAAIVTSSRVLQPVRLGYGFKNAPSHFSRTLARAIGHTPNVVNYLDDIIISADSGEELLETLDNVLGKLGAAGFKVNLNKVSLFKKNLKILGFVFNESGISSDPQKISAILDMEEPTTVTGMRRFLGMITFHSDFIPNFSKLTDPLLPYVGKSQKDGYVLNEGAKKAFREIKEIICKPVKLHLVDRSRPIYLETDASHTGFGSCAYQVAMYDKSCIPALKTNHEELLSKSKEELDSQVQEMIEEYIKTGKINPIPAKKENLPQITPEGIKEIPFLTTPIKNKSVGDIFFEIQICFFYSRKFGEAQQRSWSALMKELTCILWCVERKSDILLLASNLIILSDSKSSIYLYQQSSGNAIMSRYLSRLSTFPFTVLVRHKEGKNLLVADTLSRAWVLDPTKDNDIERVPHTSGILIETPFRPGDFITPADILRFIEKGGNQIVRNSSDPKITKETQTDSANHGHSNNIFEVSDEPTDETPTLRSSTTSQTGTRQGIRNRPALPTVTTKMSRIQQIHISFRNEVDKLTSFEQYLKYQRLELNEIIRSLTLTAQGPKRYKLENGLVMIKHQENWLRYTPPSLRILVLLKVHLLGHFGGNKTRLIVKQSDYWETLTEDSEEFCKTCLSCLFVRPPKPFKQQLGTTTPSGPMQMLQLDLVSGLPPKDGYRFFASCIDLFTKFAVIIPLKKEEAHYIANAFETHVLSKFGAPKFLITDGATNLNKSKAFQGLASFYGFQLKVRTPYASRSLGACERLHRSVLDCLRSFKDTFEMDWVSALPITNLIYNSTPHSATKFSPMEMTLGIKPQLWTWSAADLGETRWVNSEKYTINCSKELDHIRKHATSLQQEYSEKMKHSFGGKNLKVSEGSFILALDKSPATGKTKIKMRNKFVGPFLVHQVLDETVIAESCHTGRIGFVHKMFIRVIPEKDADKYERLPACAKLKLGAGHTYEHWQNLLHDDKLLETIGRGQGELTYGVESLPTMIANEKTIFEEPVNQGETRPGESDSEIENTDMELPEDSSLVEPEDEILRDNTSQRSRKVTFAI